jgi:hypothetical protein
VADLICLMGDIGNGKTETAKFLCTLGYRRGSMAERLKVSIFQTLAPLGLDYRHLWGTQADKAEPIPSLGGKTGRDFCEKVGEAYRIFPDVWLNLALYDWKKEGCPPIAFDDIRYPNEAHVLAAAGALIVTVHAPGAPVIRREHVSDNAWRDILPDFAISASYGDLEGLREKARVLVDMVPPKREPDFSLLRSEQQELPL